MDGRKVAVGVVAGVVIVVGLVRLCGGCRARRDPAVALDPADKAWLLVATGGWFACPECGKKVTLTEEQRKLGKAPAMTCPHCGKAVDWAKIGSARAPEGPPPAGKPALPSYFEDR